MKDARTAQKAIEPYIKNDALFINPITKQPYQVNSVLSHHKLAHILYPAEMVTYYEGEISSALGM